MDEQVIAGTEVRLNQITEPNEGQRRILEALGVKVESLQRGWSGMDPAGKPLQG